MKKETEVIEIIGLISKLDVKEFVGLAHLVGVPLFREDKTPYTFDEMMAGIVDSVIEMPRMRRRHLQKILKGAIRE
jgi:hypothetical protein